MSNRRQSRFQNYYLGAGNPVGLQGEKGDRGGKVEHGPARRAGIQAEHVANHSVLRPVSVPPNEHVGLFGTAPGIEQGGAAQQHSSIVRHEYIGSRQLHPLIFGMTGHDIRRIHVTVDRDHRSYRAQLDDQVRRADVARMHDMFDRIEYVEQLGIQDPMCIR